MQLSDTVRACCVVERALRRTKFLKVKLLKRKVRRKEKGYRKMKVVEAKGVWKAVTLGSNAAADKEFQFLSSIEELCPEEEAPTTSSKKQQSVAKKTKRKVKTNGASEVTPKKTKSLATEAEVEQEDAKTPSCSKWQEFGLPTPILRAIDELGFESPTEIQRLSIQAAYRDRMDVLGAAETVSCFCLLLRLRIFVQGSGKTLAFGIPIAASLLDEDEDAVGALRALVLAPTRELAVQVKQHIINVLKHTSLKVRFPLQSLH